MLEAVTKFVIEGDQMNVLFIAYYFPPDSSSGAFRPMFFANNLVDFGVHVHVLTARSDDYLPDQSVDRSLLDRVHGSVQITCCPVWRPREALISLRNKLVSLGGPDSRTTSSVPGEGKRQSRWQKIKDAFTDLMATPDPHIGWLPGCVKRGKAIIAERRPDIIYATGSPWSGLLAGVLLKKITGVPLVLDFRDPWTSNSAHAGFIPLLQVIHEKLECAALRAADGVIANTSTLRDDFLSKYPFMAEDRIITITNGFEEHLVSERSAPRTYMQIAHTGDLYLSRNPTPILTAIKNLVVRGVVAPSEIRLQFVGGITFNDQGVLDLLAGDALQQIVQLSPRVSYSEAQKYAADSDVLLLIQPDLPLQVPRKLYEYMAFCKPILCIAEAGGATGQIVGENDLGFVCGNNQEEIEATLMIIISAWRAKRLPVIAEGRCEQFRNISIAKTFHRFISEIADREGAGHL